MLAALATFIGILGLVLGIYWVALVRPETSAERKVRRRLRVASMPVADRLDLIKTDDDIPSSVQSLDHLLARAGALTTPLNTLIERSGLRTTAGIVVLASVLFGMLGFALTRLLTSSLMLSLLVGGLAALLPFLYIQRTAHKRLLMFEEQFPEAIDLIARSLRAGHAFPTALSLVAEEVPDPVRTEFRLLHDLQNYGMPLPDALRGLARRIPIVDARFFVTAVLTQREAGGNLSEVLDNLATLIRERFTVKRQVRVVSAHGRITGWVLAFLAPVLAGILTFIAPTHMRTLIEDPLGVQLVILAIVLQAIGVIIIRRIVDIEF